MTDVKDFFNEFSETYDNSAFKESLGTQWLSKIETDFILDSCKIHDGDVVLDIGIGTGRNSYLLSNRGAIIEGIDMSDGMMSKARKKLEGRKANFTLADAGKDLPFPSNIFDYVICVRVLKYIKNWRNTIKDVSRVLKKDGIFVLEISNSYSVQRLGINKNYFLFDMKDVQEILEKEGFRIENIKAGTRIAFPIYKRVNNVMVLNIITSFEGLLDNILPGYFLSRNIMIKSKKYR